MKKIKIQTVVKKAGGPSVVGRHFGISPQAVSQWRECPVSRVLSLEALTGFSRHLLRPDIYGPAPTGESE